MPIYNQPIVQIQNGLGGMDKDTSYSFADLQGNSIFSPLDYADALNIRPLSSGQSGSFANEVVLGNGSKLFSVGQVQDQNQIGTFPVFGGSVSVQYSWEIYDAYGNMIYNGNSVIYGSPSDDTVGADIVTSILTATGAGYNVSYLNGKITIENTDGDPFTLKIGYAIDGGVLQYYPFTITQELIQGRSGNFLTPIGSYDLLGDLFILSTDGTGSNTVSELGVMTYDGLSYTYTRLLRTTEWGLDWLYLPEMTGEKSQDKVNLYWVDNKNFDRCFVYNGVYLNDGALNFINPVNFYSYGNINQQTKQQKFQDGIDLTFTNQENIGGALKSGDKRYCVCLYDNQGNRTDFTMLGYAIPVSPYFWYGGSDGEQTQKYNVFNLSGINSDVFPFVRLCAVEYFNTSVSINMLPKVSTKDILKFGSITLYHFGNEIYEALNPSELGLYNTEIIYSHNNQILDNRYIKSNIKEREEIDFSEIAKLLTLSTDIILSSCEDPYMTSLSVTNSGNYLPENQQYIGYMDNENYRIGIRFEYLSGSMTKTFWVGDITINVDNADLTAGTVSGEKIRNRVIKVSNWSVFWDAVNDLSNDIKRVHFMRTPCINEVIGTGLGMACVFLGTKDGYNYICPQKISIEPDINAYALNKAVQYDINCVRHRDFIHFICPDRLMDGESINYQSGDYVKYAESFLSLGQNQLSLKTFGQINNFDFYKNTFDYSSLFTQYLGRFGNVPYSTNEDLLGVYNIDPSIKTPKIKTNHTFFSPYDSGDKINIGSSYILEQNLLVFTHWEKLEGIYVSPTVFTNTSGVPYPNISGRMYYDVNSSDYYIWNVFNNQYTNISQTQNYPIKDYSVYYNSIVKSQILNFQTSLGSSDWGKYIQYIRPLVNKYGDPKDNVWQPLNISQKNGVTNDLLCWGGDTFIQKTILKIATVETNELDNNCNMVFSFFSQNRYNTTLRGKTDSSLLGRANLGTLPWSNSVGYFAEESNPEIFIHNRQYDARLDEQVYSTFDELTITPPNKYTRIIYSQLKPVNSLVDYYLDFKPLNFRDLDAANGYISHMVVFNGELFTFQQRKLQRQFFNNDGILQSDSTDIIVGNGSVLSRRGVTLSNYGTNQKWSIVKGKSRGGDDLLMWWSTEYGCILRFGSDGIVVISDISKLNRDILESSSVINVASNISMNWGSVLSGVYDHKNREFTWTARAMKDYPTWSSDYPYEVGDIVKYDYYQQTQNPSCFDNIPFLYRCKVSGVSMNPPTEDFYMWEYIPFTDKNYYALFTLSYSLIKDRFHSFYGFRTRLYMPWRDRYLTPCPMTRQNAIQSNTISDVHLSDNGEAGAFYESELLSPLAGFSNSSDPYELNYTSANTAFQYDFYRFFIYVPEVSDFKYFFREVKANSVVLYEPWNNAIDISTKDVYVGLCWGEEPYIEFLLNTDPVSYKRPKAIQVQSTLEPVRVEFVTDENRTGNQTSVSQTSFLTSRNENNSNKSDFRLKDNHYEAGIRNQTNGHETDNTLYDKVLNSTWWKTKIKFEVGLKARLNQLVNRFTGNMRNIS